ncbi:hypothetical protein F2Q69_00007901 [Brassica cretica]|uniref:Uncharacterized protein n=1 Tax=Brassica cretica TaxID=69181 RepID=A0A8S9PG29_BRACR|nr:hypothetical protein F2Q69_00007901 [Brassica cretica]
MQKDVRGGRRGETTKLAPPYSTATLGLVTKKTPIDTFEEFADPNKAVNSKECINRLLKDEWDVYDSLFYNARLGVSIDPTRFRDSTSIDANSIASIDTLIMSSDEYADRRERRTKRRYDEASTSIQHRDPWPRDDKTSIDTFEEFANPKKAVNSKECTNRVLKDEWDDYDSLFYNA